MEEKEYWKTPLWDNSLTPGERLDYLLEEMTLEEKLQCLGTGCIAIERLGISPFYMGGEGAHGIQARHDQDFDRGEPVPTTVFPNPIGMSATWDTELIREAGRVVGNEARAIFSQERKGGLCLWAPTVDMERDPRWGRTEEAYGEDPFLAGKMAAAYVRGLRGEHPFYLRCGATLKHFYGNNVEEGRTFASSSIDPRNKQEYYLEPFRRAVTEGGAEALMTAYNEINGVPCILNPEIQKIAKEQWGVQHVVCDGGDMKQTVSSHRYFGTDAETIAAGLKAGVDCFTDDMDAVVSGAREAYRRGMVSIKEIDRAVRNHFGTMLRLGLFDREGENPYARIGMEALNAPENQEIARQMAREAVVLLKNEENILPLQKESLAGKRITVAGPMADAWYKDWYSGIPPYHVTVWEGLKKRLPQTELVLEPGIPVIRLRLEDGRYLGLLEDGATLGEVDARQAECFQVTLWDRCKATLRCRSNGKLLTLEDGIRQDPSREEEQLQRESFARGALAQGLIKASSEEAFGWFVKEVFHLYAEGSHEQEDAPCVTSVLEHGGKLRIRGWNDSLLCGDESELQVYAEVVEPGLEKAGKAAAQADQVIVVLGPDPVINSKEEVDRKDLEMPEYQEALLQKLYQANANIILVLVSSIPFGLRWEKENIPGILTTASGSMELGNGIADILLGEASPAGRLNMTWYQDSRQLPDINDYDIIRHGRTYQYFQGNVTYPFGHGLTYSAFRYEGLQAECVDLVRLRVRLEITNTGDRASDEVVQIYVKKLDPAVPRARRQLKAFQRIKEVLPGQTRRLELFIPLEDLKYYDVIARRMALEEGAYEIEAAASSEDIRQTCRIRLPGERRGLRDGSRPEPADHYDSCQNVVLQEGDKGCTCVAPRESTEEMEVVYERVRLEKAADYLVLEAQVQPGACLRIYADDKLAGEYAEVGEGLPGVSPGRLGFRQIRIPWPAEETSAEGTCQREGTHAPEAACPQEGFTLRLRSMGQARISNWYFEQ